MQPPKTNMRASIAHGTGPISLWPSCSSTKPAIAGQPRRRNACTLHPRDTGMPHHVDTDTDTAVIPARHHGPRSASTELGNKDSGVGGAARHLKPEMSQLAGARGQGNGGFAAARRRHGGRGEGGDVRVHETRTCCQLCRHLSLGRFLWMSVAGRKRPAVLDLASHEHDARWPCTQVKQSLQMDNLLGVGREDTTSDRQKKKKRKEKDVTVGLWDWWGGGGGAISAGFSEVRSSRDLTGPDMVDCGALTGSRRATPGLSGLGMVGWRGDLWLVAWLSEARDMGQDRSNFTIFFTRKASLSLVSTLPLFSPPPLSPTTIIFLSTALLSRHPHKVN